MGKFDSAKWIWNSRTGEGNTYASFFDSIDVKNSSSEYIVYISVDTNYALYINNELFDFGQYADYENDKVYDALNITKALKNGKNDIRIDVYHVGRDFSTCVNAKAGLIYTIFCGNKLIASSDENTLSCPAANYDMGLDMECCSGQLGYTFHYDSTKTNTAPVKSDLIEKPLPVRERPIKKLITGDNLAGNMHLSGGFIDIQGEKPADKMQFAALSALDEYVQRPMPSDEGYTLTVPDRFDGIYAIIDLEKEETGVASLDIEVEKDTMIYVGWGEHFDDGRVRSLCSGHYFAYSYMAHAGRNIWLHPFRRLGCRYLQIHIYAHKAKIHYCGIKTTHYPLENMKKFSCADNLHNKIYEICLRTLHMSMHEHYEDCPWREQSLYAMDSRNQILCGYYTFGEFDLPKASLRLLSESLREDGYLELCAPAKVGVDIPVFSAVWINELFEYIRYNPSDIEFIEEMLPTAKVVIDNFVSKINPEKDLLQRPDMWNFYEWGESLDGGNNCPDSSTFDSPLNAFVASSLCAFNGIVSAVEKARDGKIDPAYTDNKYSEAYDRIEKAIYDNFWNEEKNAYATYLDNEGKLYNYSELTNSIILYSDCKNVHADRKELILKNIRDGKLQHITLSHSIYKYEALLGGNCMSNEVKYGNITKENCRFVFSEIAKDWGYMLSKDATTFWETIGGANAFWNCGSLCHGWSAIPSYLYLHYAAKLPAEYTGIYEIKVD